MGYVRMQQSNFSGAISYLEQAKHDTTNDPSIDAALDTSRFYFLMGEGQTAFNENDLTTAEKQYRAALALRPNQPEALDGLGGTLMQAQQPDAAIPVFEAYVKAKPAVPAAWRGLFTAQYAAGNAPLALTTEKRIPSAVHAELMKDPQFLRTLASAYSSVGRDADASKVLESALDLPFPADAKGVKADTQLQYAGLLQAANHLDQAAGLYRQVLADDHNNLAAWQGLVRIEHAMNHDQEALQTVESMPPTTYATAMRDPGFQSTVASVYQSQKKLDVAQDLLEKSLAQQTTSGQKPSVAVQMQLAGIYLQRNNAQQAYPIYQQVLTDNPDRADAWSGLISALHTTGHDKEAVAQVQLIPAPVRAQLESNVDFLQTMGSIYSSLGMSQEALAFNTRVQQYYVTQHTAPPASVDIQNAWLLFNGMNDAGLYRQLMALGGRPDLTDDQRLTVQTIWTNWAVRRANQAAAAGNPRRAIEILNATAHSFPDNPAVLKALANGYARAGQPSQAVLIFKTQDMSAAAEPDYLSAVGAALAANDTAQAETWLRYGLAAYPTDPQMLILAAKFEQARGDSSRAIEYYRRIAERHARARPRCGARRPVEPARPNCPRHAPQRNPFAGSLHPARPRHQRPYAGRSRTPARNAALPAQLREHLRSGPGRSWHVSGDRAERRRSAVHDEPHPGPARTRHQEPPQGLCASLEPGRATGQPANPEAEQSAQSEVAATVERSVAEALAQPGPLTAEPVETQAADAGPAPAQETVAAQEVYGPYIPYVAPAAPPAPAVEQASTTPSDASPTGPVAIPVQLGRAQPVTVQVANEATDILPTAHYVPNARGGNPTSSHPDIAAAQAASIRRNQSNPDPTDPRVGQSNPPAEEYTTSTENTQYTPQPSYQGQSGSPLTTQPSRTVTSSSTSGSVPDTGEQQYPQPRRTTQDLPTLTPERRRTRKPVVAKSTPAPKEETAAAPAPPAAPSQVVNVYPPAAYPGLSYPGTGAPPGGLPYPMAGANYPLGTAPDDAELMARNIPPLRGPYTRTSPRHSRRVSRRSLRSPRSKAPTAAGWAARGSDATAAAPPGLDRLYDIEAPVEASVTVNRTMRLTVVPKAVFLNSGALDTSTFTGLTVPYIGTLPASASTPPAQQFSNGIGGEMQLTTRNIGLAVGYTPYEFLVHNLTARFRYRPFGGHFTLFGDRDAVKDTQLSYAGLRDPNTISPTYGGNIWGGVVSTTGGVRLDVGSGGSGFYLSGDGGVLNGYHVLDNTKFEGSMGAYFRAKDWPGYGTLTPRRQPLRHALCSQRAGPDVRPGRLLQPERLFPGGHPGGLQRLLQVDVPLHHLGSGWRADLPAGYGPVLPARCAARDGRPVDLHPAANLRA